MQKTHRVIYKLHFLLWNNRHVQVTLDLTGNATGDANDGRPHPPKLRKIDLRPGDKVMFGQSWYLIRGIVCTRDEWLTDEAAALGGDAGRGRGVCKKSAAFGAACVVGPPAALSWGRWGAGQNKRDDFGANRLNILLPAWPSCLRKELDSLGGPRYDGHLERAAKGALSAPFRNRKGALV